MAVLNDRQRPIDLDAGVNQTGLIIRSARESDLRAALALVSVNTAWNRRLDRITELCAEAIRGTSGEYHSFLAERNYRCLGVAVYGSVTGTIGTVLLHAVILADDSAYAETGTRIIVHIIDQLRSVHARLLVAEVSGHGNLAGYRSLLEAQGFAEESRIDDYYEDGVPLIQYRLDLN